MNGKIIACLLALTTSACTKDGESEKLTPTCDGSNPTYTSDIKSIVDSRCGSSNCHANYTTYQGLEGILQNGEFEREVLSRQTMPEGSSLTHEPINKFQCWADNGFPEN